MQTASVSKSSSAKQQLQPPSQFQEGRIQQHQQGNNWTCSGNQMCNNFETNRQPDKKRRAQMAWKHQETLSFFVHFSLQHHVSSFSSMTNNNLYSSLQTSPGLGLLSMRLPMRCTSNRNKTVCSYKRVFGRVG